MSITQITEYVYYEVRIICEDNRGKSEFEFNLAALEVPTTQTK